MLSQKWYFFSISELVQCGKYSSLSLIHRKIFDEFYLTEELCTEFFESLESKVLQQVSFLKASCKDRSFIISNKRFANFEYFIHKKYHIISECSTQKLNNQLPKSIFLRTEFINKNFNFKVESSRKLDFRVLSSTFPPCRSLHPQNFDFSGRNLINLGKTPI